MVTMDTEGDKSEAKFTQVHALRPGTSGHNLHVKVRREGKGSRRKKKKKRKKQSVSKVGKGKRVMEISSGPLYL